MDLKLTVAHGEECHELTFSRTSSTSEIRIVGELISSHEEADTRMMCHALFASKSSGWVEIQSPDTDVLVLAISKCKDMDCKLYFETGTGNNRRLLDVSIIHQQLSEAHVYAPEALIGLHTFTGCDSLSSFHGKRKVKPLNLMLCEPKFVELFRNVGS